MHKTDKSCLFGFSNVTIQTHNKQTTSTQNCSSSYNYGCSTCLEIPCLSENIYFKHNYKILHIKIWTQYSLINIPTAVCVLCCRLQYCTEEHSTPSYHKPNTNNPILPHYFFQTLTLQYPPESPKVVPPVQVSYTNFVFHSSLLYACYMSHISHLPCYDC
jgi:hypothetical protein